ncbi:MAG: type III pantothenate kinase [Woeseia sp.]|nr:type III pantothenate kinase [Woeseia sp.]NNL54269.1 type III pantothenate kinase [Woeseia sp.]
MKFPRALLFDIGNTRLKWGLAENGKIRRTGSINHERLREQGFAALTTRLPAKVDAVLASNVAGQTFATRLSGVISLHCDCDMHFARSAASGFGVTNSYRQARRLGVDRWAAMIGVHAQIRKAVCIVDAGTAVTIDALDKSGQHLGGQILPGVRLMTDALTRDTSDLPAVKRAPPQSHGALPGFVNSTGSAIYTGSMAAVCGAIEKAVHSMRSAGYRPALVLTGGDASRILPLLNAPAEHRPNLVLEGLAIMIEGKP